MNKILALLVLLPCLPPAAAAHGNGGDLLDEVPIWPVPAEMSLEEYADANRRLGVGLLLLSVPLPGTLHFYAGESRAGWKHVGAAALGLSSIALGLALADEKDAWEKSDFAVVDIRGESGQVQRYEKIPIEEENGVLTYRLRKLDRKTEGGGLFAALGAGLLVGQLLHDWIGGIRTIERKRNAVRYKYGKTAGYSLGLEPSVGRGQVGAEVSLRF